MPRANREDTRMNRSNGMSRARDHSVPSLVQAHLYLLFTQTQAMALRFAPERRPAAPGQRDHHAYWCNFQADPLNRWLCSGEHSRYAGALRIRADRHRPALLHESPPQALPRPPPRVPAGAKRPATSQQGISASGPGARPIRRTAPAAMSRERSAKGPVCPPWSRRAGAKARPAGGSRPMRRSKAIGRPSQRIRQRQHPSGSLSPMIRGHLSTR